MSGSSLADRLHPRLRAWFRTRFGAFTDAQERCVPAILDGESVLLSSPTGSGKTLAGFLGILDGLIREHEAGTLTNRVRAVYVSPLRALTYDIRKNLAEPLREMGLEETIRIASRTGDTPASERAAFRRRPPHILLTTPESLAVMICQSSLSPAFEPCRFVIIDELHALAENKRGAHLMVSLERLEEMVARRETRVAGLCRIGLSATVAPLDEVAAFLAGAGRPCRIAEAAPGRRSIVEVMSPLRRDPYPPAGYTAARMIRDIARVVEARRSVIIFTNTRSGAEGVSHRLKQVLPELAPAIETHHSSLDRDVRLHVEDRLKAGELRAVVCSTSLELGIDIGSIDAVIMISTPKGVSRTLQRVGRSGHSIHRSSHGILCATNINDLVECAVCAEMTKQRRLDPVRILNAPLDVAAQHIVGMAMNGGVHPDRAFDILRRAYPFRKLPRSEFDCLVDYLEGGGRALRRQYAHAFGKISRDADTGRLVTPSRKVEREYLVNIGTIQTAGMVSVLLGRRKLGSVEEGFIKGMKIGDTFVLAGRVVRLIGTGVGEASVEDAGGAMPTVPSWNANKMPLASGLAREVTAFRTEISRLLAEKRMPASQVREVLVENHALSATNAEAVTRHFQSQLAISRIPVDRLVLIECFRPDDDSPGAEPDISCFFFHTLIGRSANDALSRIIARRLKDAVGGNAMVTIDDYGFLLTVRRFQELDLDEWRELFHPDHAERDLLAALEQSELVKWQFRGVAQTGLMAPRALPGRPRRLREVRWSAEILFRVLREREPDHPLLRQAVDEAMHTFLDAERAAAFLRECQSFDWDLVHVPAVSPFAFGLFVSKIRESMMLEDPEAAIERLFHDMSEKVRKAALENA